MTQRYEVSNNQSIQENWEELEPIPGTIMVRWLSEPEQVQNSLLYRPESSIRWEVVGTVLDLGEKTDPKLIDLEIGDMVFANSLWGSSLWEGKLIDDELGIERKCMIRIIGWNEVVARKRRERKPAGFRLVE